MDAAYAHCETITPPKAESFTLWRAYLARGAQVTSVSVSHGSLTSTRQALVQVAELAADALAAARP